MEKYYWLASQQTVIVSIVTAVITIVAGFRAWKTRRRFEGEVFRVGAALGAVMLISFAVGDELTSRITRNSAVPVKGRVTDITGGGIVGATVRITNTQSDVAWEAITDSAGTYAFPNLEPGTYKVEVTANGFRKYEQQPVKVAAGFNLALPLKPAP